MSEIHEGEFFETAEEIFEVDDVKVEVVAVPQWGGKKVRLKMMTAAERDAFEASTVETKRGRQKPNLDNLRARLVARCLVNSAGERIFQSGDVVRLGRKSAQAIDFLFQKCQDLNGFTEKDIEDLTEDFDGTTEKD